MKKRIPKTLRPNSGFTIVEILIVVFVIGLMSGFGMLSIQRILPQMRTEKASSRLAFQLQLSRSEAIATNQMIWVGLDTDSNEFSSWIDRDGDATRDADELSTVELAEPDLVDISSEWTSGLFNAFGQFILTPGQREIRTVSTTFSSGGGQFQEELILRGSGAITKR